MRITKTDKIIISAVLIGVLAIGVLGNAQHRLQTTLNLQPRITYQLPTPGSAVGLQWPTVGQAAIGAKGYGVLASNVAQTPVPTASIAKLITALAVLKVKPLTSGEQGPSLLLTQSDIDYYNAYRAVNGSVAKVSVGEQISEYQVLQAMLLPSANNLADSLATWAFGSLPAYRAYANKMLTDYGLTDTTIGSDASGFSPDTTSTASNLVSLGEIVLSSPVLSDIANQSTASLPVAGNVRNVNWLLGTAGINGLKTGNSDQAGGAFLFSAEYAASPSYRITIVGAVMKAANLSQAMSSALSLLTSAQKAFSLVNAVTAGQIIGTYQVPWGTAASASASSDVKALAWQGVVIDKPVIALKDLKAPVDKNSPVGSVKTAATSTQVSVNLDQPITAPSLWWRLTHN